MKSQSGEGVMRTYGERRAHVGCGDVVFSE
jgi:hypothetical protein